MEVHVGWKLKLKLAELKLISEVEVGSWKLEVEVGS